MEKDRFQGIPSNLEEQKDSPTEMIDTDPYAAYLPSTEGSYATPFGKESLEEDGLASSSPLHKEERGGAEPKAPKPEPFGHSHYGKKSEKSAFPDAQERKELMSRYAQIMEESEAEEIWDQEEMSFFERRRQKKEEKRRQKELRRLETEWDEMEEDAEEEEEASDFLLLEKEGEEEEPGSRESDGFTRESRAIDDQNANLLGAEEGHRHPKNPPAVLPEGFAGGAFYPDPDGPGSTSEFTIASREFSSIQTPLKGGKEKEEGSRQTPIRSFPRKKKGEDSFEKSSPEPQLLLEELPEDFRHPAQRKEKADLLNKAVGSAYQKSALLFLLTLFGIYFAATPYSRALPFPGYFDPLLQSRHFVVLNLVVFVLAILLFLRPFWKGLLSFGKGRPDENALLSLSAVAGLLQLIYLFFNKTLMGENASVHIYLAVTIAGFFFSRLGEALKTTSVRLNFNVVSSYKQKYQVACVPDSPFRDSVIKLTGVPDSEIVVPQETGFLQRFLELSGETASGELFPSDRRLPYVAVVAALFTSLICALLLPDGFAVAISAFLGTLVVCAGFLPILRHALPLYKTARKLSPKGAFLANEDVFFDLAQSTSVVCDAADLFPKGAVVLQGLKTFEGGRIDDAILDACSVMVTMGGTLSNLFLQIIEYRTDLLNPVESIIYEEGGGIVAWSEGRRVLIGNRKLMRQYGIDAPSDDYEEKYRRGGRDLVYLASSGVLTAMYIVKYKAERHIRERLQRLTQEGVTILVRTADPNVTPEKMAELFDIPLDSVRALSERTVRALDAVTKPVARADATAAFSGNFLGYLTTLSAAIRFSPTIAMLRILHIVSAILGYLLITFSAFFTQISTITPLFLLLYNLAWVILIWLLCWFRHF